MYLYILGKLAPPKNVILAKILEQKSPNEFALNVGIE